MSPTSSLTVAVLKQLCKDKELAISGKKADLVSRLLKYGASEEELGIEVEEESEGTEIIEDEEGELILESEIVEEKEIFEADEVLEAEILEAEILEVELVEEDEEIPTLIETALGTRFSTPEVDWKKTAAIVASLLILGGGAWWWFSLEAQPFTPDPLRHGDEMGFAVTGGEMVATGEYASKVFEWFGSDDEVCELNVDFSGKGSIKIKEGDSTDLSGEMGDDRLGAVKQRGGSGFSWLTMEKALQYDFDDVSISKSEQLKIGCQEMPSVSARVGIDWTEWVEISGQNTLRSQFDYELTHPDGHLLGEVTSFGLGGVIDSLDALGMGASMIFAPLQVHEVLGNTLIDEEAAGNVSGWSWRVTGSEEFGDEMAWKILFQNKDLEKHCLGHATIHVLVIPSSPWAVRQSTDLLITNEDSSNCGTLEEILGEYAMPEGRLELRMSIEKTSLSRGEHLVDLGLSYDSKPDFSALRPPSSEMQDWASNNQMHTPDNSTKRSHSLELAVSCIDVFNTPARDALRDYQAYIWRAQDNRADSSKTTWNMSWVSFPDDLSGWIIIDVSGTTASSETCTIISEGMHDDAPTHNRNAIPESPSITWMESNRWLDGGFFPKFSGSDGLAAKNGQWHSDLKLGILVATTGFDLPDSLDFLPVNDAGRTTIDGIRSWDEGDWSHTFTFAADATDGQILGWSHVWSSD